MSEFSGRVVELFDSTCTKQFESMHCDIRSLSDLSFKAKDDWVCASIDCHSDDVELTLIIAAAQGFLVNTMPKIDGQQLDSDLFQKDWCLELANRFLGRLKNKLLSHGCPLAMGLPELINCHADQGELKKSETVVSRVFQIMGSDEDGLIRCELSIRPLSDKVSLDDYEDEDEDWFDESEIQHL